MAMAMAMGYGCGCHKHNSLCRCEIARLQHAQYRWALEGRMAVEIELDKESLHNHVLGELNRTTILILNDDRFAKMH